ncbi:hypothetical protein ACF0H5_023271 [Mactra antiquata]
MSYVAKDGISDCHKLCNPEKGYSIVSCAKVCPDYILSTTISIADMIQPAVDTDTIPVGHVILIIAIAVGLFLVIGVCYCKRQPISKVFMRLWDDISKATNGDVPDSKNIETQTEPNNNITTEKDNLLQSVHGGNSTEQRQLDEEARQHGGLSVAVRDSNVLEPSVTVPHQHGRQPTNSNSRRNTSTCKYVDIEEIHGNNGSVYVNMRDFNRHIGQRPFNQSNNQQDIDYTGICGSTRPLEDQKLPNARKNSTGSFRSANRETNQTPRDQVESRDQDSTEDISDKNKLNVVIELRKTS